MTDSTHDDSAPAESRDLGAYEMLWDCAHCGASKLLAHSHRFCPHCGAEQDPEKRYFPEEADKVAVEQHFYFGNDLPCPRCEAMNGANADFCHRCGAPLSAAAAAASPAGQPKPPQAGENNTGWAGKAGIGATVAAGIGIGYFLLGGKTVGVEAAGLEWERTIEVQSFGPQSRQVWCDSLPSGATEVSRKRQEKERRKVPQSHACEAWCDELPATLMVNPNEIRQVAEERSHNQVKTGEKCITERIDQGDGTFREQQACTPEYRKEPVMAQKCYLELPGDSAKPSGMQCKTRYREEPVYAQMCDFKINDWGPERTAEARGADREPHWPETRLDPQGECLGCEREGPRSERYTVVFHAPEDAQTYRCDLPFSEWERIDPGTHWEIDIHANAADCSDMKRTR